MKDAGIKLKGARLEGDSAGQLVAVERGLGHDEERRRRDGRRR